jgi:hypothetical protein
LTSALVGGEYTQGQYVRELEAKLYTSINSFLHFRMGVSFSHRDVLNMVEENNAIFPDKNRSWLQMN